MPQTNTKTDAVDIDGLDKEELDFAREWFGAQVRAGAKKQFTSEAVLIGPELAAVMLEQNMVNRSVRKSRVVLLAKEIEGQRWSRTHQGIAFDSQGHLLDGQHRLMAIIHVGLPVTIDVSFGLDPSAFKVIDTHSQRTAADALHIQGDVDAKSLAAIAAFMLLIRAGYRAGNATNRPSHGQVAEFVHATPEIRVAAKHAQAIRKALGGGAKAGLGVGLHRIRTALPEQLQERYDQFVERLRSGIGFRSESDPVARLRSRLMKRDLRGIESAACVIKAWNAWREGRALPRINWREDEEFPAVLTQ